MPNITVNRKGLAQGANDALFTTARQSDADFVTDGPTGNVASTPQAGKFSRGGVKECCFWG